MLVRFAHSLSSKRIASYWYLNPTTVQHCNKEELKSTSKEVSPHAPWPALFLLPDLMDQKVCSKFGVSSNQVGLCSGYVYCLKTDRIGVLTPTKTLSSITGMSLLDLKTTRSE